MSKIRTAYRLYSQNGLRGIIGSILSRLQTGDRPEIIDISDDYINWLCFANAGMLDRGNLYCFDYAIRNLPPDSSIVEIGSFSGLSTNVITRYKGLHGVKSPIFTCDKWEFEGAEGGGSLAGSSITHAEYRQFVRENFIRNVRMFSRNDLPHTIELFSDDFFAAWSRERELTDVFGRSVRLGGPIGFCYIDGNHSYDFARRDFENCDRFLVNGGFILFDDSADGSGWEVCRVVAEVLQSGRYHLIAKNPNYFFRKIA
ncbi:MAG: class I SAM-dependent methyltransferase [Acidobacteriota bacterium]|nr:MAG: class I SAM-dependent methyltransferase [Acidobacteriota bacterium]